jgi:hypothetical protein
MAEAVAVIGLLSSIVQLVDFGTKLIDRLNEFASATEDVPVSFRSIKSQLPLAIITLDSYQARQAGLPVGITARGRECCPLANPSSLAGNPVNEIMTKYVSELGTRYVSARHRAFKHANVISSLRTKPPIQPALLHSALNPPQAPGESVEVG